MDDIAPIPNIKRTSSKKRSKSHRDKSELNTKDINLDVKSIYSSTSGKKSRRKRKSSVKSTFKDKIKDKRVTFKKNFIEVVHIENWKDYNNDVSVDSRDNSSGRGKDKVRCACLII
jgi:hypothetical protein